MRILKVGKKSNEISNDVVSKILVDLGDKIKEKLTVENFEIRNNWFEIIDSTTGIVDDVYYSVMGLYNILVCKTCDIEGFEKVVD